MSFLVRYLFTAHNPTLTGDIGNAGDIMQFGTDLGKQDLTQASGFDSSLLSGDPNAIGKLLGPQFSTIQKQGQQQLDTERLNFTTAPVARMPRTKLTSTPSEPMWRS